MDDYDIFKKHKDKLKDLYNLINKTEWYRDKDFLIRLKRKPIEKYIYTILTDNIIPTLEELYGNNYHLELHIDYNDGGNCQQMYYIFAIDIYIRYPKVTVRNGKRNQSTELTNHFQKQTIYIDNFGMSLGSLEARTVNPTLQQFNYKYAHSHLNSCDYTNGFKSFCTGSSTEYQILKDTLSSEKHVEYDTWYMFFMNLTTIAETESLVGRPYRKLNELSLGERGSSTNLTGSDTYITLYNSEENKTPVNWTIENGLYSVVDDEILEQHCIVKFNSLWDKWKMYKDSLGNYYGTTRFNDVDSSYLQWSFTDFKDHVYPFGFSEGEAQTNNQIYIHPKLKKYVKNRLEFQANEKTIIEKT